MSSAEIVREIISRKDIAYKRYTKSLKQYDKGTCPYEVVQHNLAVFETLRDLAHDIGIEDK